MFQMWRLCQTSVSGDRHKSIYAANGKCMYVAPVYPVRVHCIACLHDILLYDMDAVLTHRNLIILLNTVTEFM